MYVQLRVRWIPIVRPWLHSISARISPLSHLPVSLFRSGPSCTPICAAQRYEVLLLATVMAR